MSKLYYTDPLAAAYMAREFGVRYLYDFQHGPERSERDKYGHVLGHFLFEMEDVVESQQEQFHIHLDSFHIFEFMVGDVYTDEYGKVYDYGEYSVVADCGIGEGKIIQRDGKPFFMPEGE